MIKILSMNNLSHLTWRIITVDNISNINSIVVLVDNKIKRLLFLMMKLENCSKKQITFLLNKNYEKLELYRY